MNLTDKEAEKIIDRVRTNVTYQYSKIDALKDSYFEPDNDFGMYEFDFGNVKELQSLLAARKEVIKDGVMELVLSVAVFKHKPQKMINPIFEEEEKIPDFIYNF